MVAYYNEFDPRAAAWLRELIKAGFITDGDVDERSITEVEPQDLRGFTRCHFFAGIAGWELALQLASWPKDVPVWTGSCPCQPFSVAGKRRGTADERHLWPAFFRLIAECRPPTIFGEQVEGAIRHGWIDGVQADLESEGYACGYHVLGAHSVGAPHIRQRLFWVADSGYIQSGSRHGGTKLLEETQRTQPSEHASAGRVAGGMADARGAKQRGISSRERTEISETRGSRQECCGLGDASGQRFHGSEGSAEPRRRGGIEDSSPWSDYTLIPCRDGKTRRIKSSLEPLAHGLPGRVGLLRGYGNAIVPQDAAAFIDAYCAAAT